MKPILSSFLISLLLISCGSQSSGEKGQLTTINADLKGEEASQTTNSAIPESTFSGLSLLPQILVGQVSSLQTGSDSNSKYPTMLFSRLGRGSGPGNRALSAAFADIPKNARQPLLVLQNLAQAITCLDQKVLAGSAAPSPLSTVTLGAIQFSHSTLLAQIKGAGCADFSDSNTDTATSDQEGPAQADGELLWNEQSVTLSLPHLKLPGWYWNVLTIKMNRSADISAVYNAPQVVMAGQYHGHNFELNFINFGDWWVTENGQKCSSNNAESCSQFFGL